MILSYNPIEEIIQGQLKIFCDRLYISYHETGGIKEIGYQGLPFGGGVPVGVWSYYDTLGRLYKTLDYIYEKKQNKEEGKSYVIEKEYYYNNVLKSEKKYSNHYYYESYEPEPLGVWKYYNESGKLIKTEKHKSSL